MIKIAIVEDEKEYVQTLTEYLTLFENENSIKFQTSTYSDGLEIVSEYRPSYDIILLDIQMKHLNGMKTAEKIRKLDEDVIFIFITSSSQFAMEGYEVDALGYVLKPVPYPAFSQIMGKALRRIKKKQEAHYINIDVEDGMIRLNTDFIYYAESRLHRVLLHTEKGDFLTSGPLKRLEASLSSFGFAKCHNAYLVNLKHVIGSLQGFILLTSGEKIPASRTRKKIFMDLLSDYLGG